MRKAATRCDACYRERMEKHLASARAIVARGTCPDCGQPLRRNLAISGWWQCAGYGADGFRAPGSSPCLFQTFTE